MPSLRDLLADSVRGMPAYRSQPLVVAELDAIHAYLLARARGDIGPGRPSRSARGNAPAR